jgi:hypothetical protein
VGAEAPPLPLRGGTSLSKNPGGGPPAPRDALEGPAPDGAAGASRRAAFAGRAAEPLGRPRCSAFWRNIDFNMRALLSIASRSSPLARARRAVSARAAAMAFNTPVASSVRPRFVTNQVANASPRKAFESGDRQAEAVPPVFRVRDATRVWAFSQTRFRRNSGIHARPRRGKTRTCGAPATTRSTSTRAYARAPARLAHRPLFVAHAHAARTA